MLDVQPFRSSFTPSQSTTHSRILTHCAAKIGGPNDPIWCSVVVQQGPTMVDSFSVSRKKDLRNCSTKVALFRHNRIQGDSQ